MTAQPFNLMASLGMDQVEGDPNALPDGKWVAEVSASDYVHAKNKNTYAHVLSYKVVEGTKKGAIKQEWFTIGEDPVFAEDGTTLVGLTPTMTPDQKSWYKKRLLDLGVEESQIDDGTFRPHQVVGLPITFGTKKKEGYINVNFVELRTPTTSAPGTTTGALSGLL